MESYFVEECDYVCKYYRPIVDSVYSKFSKLKVIISLFDIGQTWAKKIHVFRGTERDLHKMFIV